MGVPIRPLVPIRVPIPYLEETPMGDQSKSTEPNMSIKLIWFFWFLNNTEFIGVSIPKVNYLNTSVFWVKKYTIQIRHFQWSKNTKQCFGPRITIALIHQCMVFVACKVYPPNLYNLWPCYRSFTTFKGVNQTDFLLRIFLSNQPQS